MNVVGLRMLCRYVIEVVYKICRMRVEKEFCEYKVWDITNDIYHTYQLLSVPQQKVYKTILILQPVLLQWYSTINVYCWRRTSPIIQTKDTVVYPFADICTYDWAPPSSIDKLCSVAWLFSSYQGIGILHRSINNSSLLQILYILLQFDHMFMHVSLRSFHCNTSINSLQFWDTPCNSSIPPSHTIDPLVLIETQ